jgi:hypothetical protein
MGQVAGATASTTLPKPTSSPLPGTRGAVCSRDQPCQSADLFCAYPTLLCGGNGVCEEVPGMCTAESRPVCGCDFTTYGNPCLAAAAGLATFAFSACNDSLKCMADRDCGEGFHCRYPAEQCSGVGLCSRIPDMCTLELNSVCGCNNQTYSNPCMAFASGVSIHSLGECQVENAFACQNDSECGPNQYCRYDPGLCGGIGTCINVPSACTLELNPVCGCNNVTYDNQCIAATAGISIDSLGACEDIQPCMNDTDCDFGQFCRFPAGTCGGIGSCANAPNVCTLELNPVCGCDNSTYDNVCLAQASGVSVLDVCPCQAAVSCANNSDCEADEYCHFVIGECGGVGSCASIPQDCTLLVNPVCGCDNVTYDNPCVASAAGASVQSVGECQGAVGGGSCANDSDCRADGQYCQFRDGQCGGTGMCVDLPEVCTLELLPVCGCDGRTYGNRCGAQTQGVSILSTSSCPSPRPT